MDDILKDIESIRSDLRIQRMRLRDIQIALKWGVPLRAASFVGV